MEAETVDAAWAQVDTLDGGDYTEVPDSGEFRVEGVYHA